MVVAADSRVVSLMKTALISAGRPGGRQDRDRRRSGRVPGRNDDVFGQGAGVNGVAALGKGERRRLMIEQARHRR